MAFFGLKNVEGCMMTSAGFGANRQLNAIQEAYSYSRIVLSPLPLRRVALAHGIQV